jgi:hypothetical protein
MKCHRHEDSVKAENKTGSARGTAFLTRFICNTDRCLRNAAPTELACIFSPLYQLFTPPGLSDYYLIIDNFLKYEMPSA